MKTVAIILIALLLGGCASSGKAGFQILKPWTYFSHREASSADRAEGKVNVAQGRRDDARESLIKAAQVEVHRADVALASAPESRPVAVASDATGNAAAALDQAVGPLSVDAARELRNRVVALLSENAEIRGAAEKRQQADTLALVNAGHRLAKTEEALAAAESKLRSKQDELRVAFDRENAKANQLRGMQWAVGGLAFLLLIAGAGYLYLRVSSGGLISSLVGGIEAFKTGRNKEDPVVSELLAKLSGSMDRSEKKQVRSVISKVSK